MNSNSNSNSNFQYSFNNSFFIITMINTSLLISHNNVLFLSIRLSGRHPFPQHDDRAMYYNILHGIFNFDDESWINVSDDAKDFITRLLCVEPDKRMTAKEVSLMNVNCQFSITYDDIILIYRLLFIDG